MPEAAVASSGPPRKKAPRRSRWAMSSMRPASVPTMLDAMSSTAATTARARFGMIDSPQPTSPSSVVTRTNIHRGGTR